MRAGFGTAAAIVGAFLFGSLFGAAPAPLKEVAPVSDLEIEAASQLKTLEGLLKDNTAFGDKEVGKKKIGRAAGVLAVIGQSVAEHSDKASAKLAGPDLRDAARRVVTAASYEDAVAAIPDIKSALEGKSTGKAAADHAWNKLMSLHRLMEEVKEKQGLLRDTFNAAQKGEPLRKEDAAHASTLAVLGVVMVVDTHEVKKPEDIPDYQAIAKEFLKTSSELSVALHKGDAAAFKETFPKLTMQCASCHKKYRN